MEKTNEELKRIGAELAELRRQRGLTLRALSAQCGVSFENISRIEKGRYNPSVAVLSKVLHALGARITLDNSAPPMDNTAATPSPTDT